MSSNSGSEITIATAFDNYNVDARLATRWGFAAVISTPSSTVLFDTGDDGATLLSNMNTLGIDPNGLNKVVISHIHADHIGGLRDVLRTNAKVQVFVPRSFPDHVRRAINAAGATHQDVDGPTRIAPGIHTTGPLGTSLQEQALVVETREGLVVITGCAHPGIVSVVKKAQAVSPKTDIALMNGRVLPPALFFTERDQRNHPRLPRTRRSARCSISLHRRPRAQPLQGSLPSELCR